MTRDSPINRCCKGARQLSEQRAAEQRCFLQQSVRFLNQPHFSALQAAPSGDESSSAASGPQVALLFATADHGVLLQEFQSSLPQDAAGLLGLAAPSVLLRRANPAPGEPALLRAPMQVRGLATPPSCKQAWLLCA